MSTHIPLALNPDEIAFRKIERPLLEKGTIHVIFRPGNRLCGQPRGYCVGQKVTAKVLDKVGADWAMVKPVFEHDFSRSVTIENVELKTIGELIPDDFRRAAPFIHDQDSLVYYLGLIYNMSKDALSPDSIITKTTFTYDE